MGVLVPKQFNFNLLLQFLQRVYGEEMTSAMLSQLLRDGEEGGIKGEPIPETVLRGGGMSWEREYAGGYIIDAGIKRKPVVRVPTGRIADWIVSRDEVLRFIAENPPTAAAPEPATTAPSTPPQKELLKVLVARAAWEVHKETGKMHYKDIIDKLRIMKNSEDQAGAIIENASTTKGVTIIGRDEPIAVGTIKNWLCPLRAEAKRQAVTESRK